MLKDLILNAAVEIEGKSNFGVDRKKESSVNSKRNQALFIKAIERADEKAVLNFLRDGIDVNFLVQDKQKFIYPLGAAMCAEYFSENILEMLLDYGAKDVLSKKSLDLGWREEIISKINEKNKSGKLNFEGAAIGEVSIRELLLLMKGGVVDCKKEFPVFDFLESLSSSNLLTSQKMKNFINDLDSSVISLLFEDMRSCTGKMTDFLLNNYILPTIESAHKISFSDNRLVFGNSNLENLRSNFVAEVAENVQVKEEEDSGFWVAIVNGEGVSQGASINALLVAKNDENPGRDLEGIHGESKTLKELLSECTVYGYDEKRLSLLIYCYSLLNEIEENESKKNVKSNTVAIEGTKKDCVESLILNEFWQKTFECDSVHCMKMLCENNLMPKNEKLYFQLYNFFLNNYGNEFGAPTGYLKKLSTVYGGYEWVVPEKKESSVMSGFDESASLLCVALLRGSKQCSRILMSVEALKKNMSESVKENAFLVYASDMLNVLDVLKQGDYDLNLVKDVNGINPLHQVIRNENTKAMIASVLKINKEWVFGRTNDGRAPVDYLSGKNSLNYKSLIDDVVLRSQIGRKGKQADRVSIGRKSL